MISRHRVVAFSVLASLALSLCFFSPRLWLMVHDTPGSYQWDRAHTFLLQCEQPFRRDIEPAMLWRLLPPLVCHALGLRGAAALALPWLGVIAATTLVATLLSRRNPHPRFVFGGTLLFATTSAVLVPTGWLGMNDAWVWLGLLAFSFCDSKTAQFGACLLCPWIDERFLIGLPLALAVRATDRNETIRSQLLWPLLGMLPYVGLRLAGSGNPQTASATSGFLKTTIPATLILLPLAPLAWWMGLRAAWVAVVLGARRRPFLLGSGVILTLGICLPIASDMSRNAALLIPIVLLGVFQFAAEWPERAPQGVLLAGITNLLIPAAHITYTKIDAISLLPVELWRVYRGH
jgi:hypothetical protein